MTPLDANASPELGYLLALLRVALGSGEASPRPPQGMEWDKLLREIERHRVGGLLQRRAKDAPATDWPPDAAARLSVLAQATARRAFQLAGEHLRLARALEREGIPALGVKGLPLAQRLYGEQGIRHAGDIDLLVRLRDVEKADRILQAEGLRRTNPSFALTPRQQRCFTETKPEFEYVRPAAAIRVELLWRLEGLPLDEAFWAPALPGAGLNPLARTLPADLDALYVLQHGARHGWFRLFWLLDAALLLRSPTLDGAALIDTARRLDVALPVLQAAELVRQLLRVPIPAPLVPRPEERARVEALVAEAWRQIAREPLEHETVGEWARQLRYRIRLQQTWRRRWAMLTPHLYSPESWRALPLPDRWFFLYPLVTPWLWLRRRKARAGA